MHCRRIEDYEYYRTNLMAGNYTDSFEGLTTFTTFTTFGFSLWLRDGTS